MMVDLIVVPKSGRFAIDAKEGRIKIFLRSAAEQNKANIELVKELSRLVGDVRIVSGLKSRRKRIEVDAGRWGLLVNKIKKS